MNISKLLANMFGISVSEAKRKIKEGAFKKNDYRITEDCPCVLSFDNIEVWNVCDGDTFYYGKKMCRRLQIVN